VPGERGRLQRVSPIPSRPKIRLPTQVWWWFGLLSPAIVVCPGPCASTALCNFQVRHDAVTIVPAMTRYVSRRPHPSGNVVAGRRRVSLTYRCFLHPLCGELFFSVLGLRDDHVGPTFSNPGVSAPACESPSRVWPHSLGRVQDRMRQNDPGKAPPCPAAPPRARP